LKNAVALYVLAAISDSTAALLAFLCLQLTVAGKEKDRFCKESAMGCLNTVFIYVPKDTNSCETASVK